MRRTTTRGACNGRKYFFSTALRGSPPRLHYLLQPLVSSGAGLCARSSSAPSDPIAASLSIESRANASSGASPPRRASAPARAQRASPRCGGYAASRGAASSPNARKAEGAIGGACFAPRVVAAAARARQRAAGAPAPSRARALRIRADADGDAARARHRPRGGAAAPRWCHSRRFLSRRLVLLPSSSSATAKRSSARSSAMTASSWFRSADVLAACLRDQRQSSAAAGRFASRRVARRQAFLPSVRRRRARRLRQTFSSRSLRRARTSPRPTRRAGSAFSRAARSVGHELRG